MRKFILPLVLSWLVMAHTSYATSVSQQDAQHVATNFYLLNVPNAPSSLTTSLVYTKTDLSGAVIFYVFGVNQATGFVIVAADDAIEPVIGFSSESNFYLSAASMTGLKDWMNTTTQKISLAVQHHAQADADITDQWTSYMHGINPHSARTASVAPLLTTTWDQTPYYNQLCPFNTPDNQRCVTGCVATAMAQIMKYWNFPTTGNGSFSYNDATSAGYSYTYGTQSANFGATTYGWSSMPTSISTNNTSLATLMYHCGVAVAMDYGDINQGGSGAYVLQSDAGSGNPCAQYAYSHYFRYNATSLQGVYYSNYTSAAWVTLMEGELNAGRPIQYEGADPNAGGHTWVCDGYNTSNQLHMNWGWGGYNNGYFSVTALTVSPYTFSANDAALIGIQPGTINTVTCAVPSGLASSTITATGATVSWTAVSGATSYNLQYKATAASAWTTVSVTTTSKALTGLTAGTAYNYQVQTVCASGTSAYSAASTFTTTAQATCGVAGGLASSAITSSGATVSWTAVAGATSYNLQYKIASSTAWTTVSVATASKSLTGLSTGTTYNYQVQTVCANGTSAYSTASSFATTSTGCGVAGGLAASAITTTGATVSWTAVAGATAYSLQYKLSTATTWTTVSVTAASQVLTGLTPAAIYNFQVKTICSNTATPYSAAASFTTATPCGVASGLASSGITGTAATVSWTAVAGATAYNLQYKAASASAWTTVSVTNSSKALTGLTGNTTSNYQVQVVCPSGTSAYSASASFTTTVAPPSYCAASGSTQTYEWISHVKLGTINRTSVAEPGGYVSTGLATNLRIGSGNDTIFFSPSFAGAGYTENWAVYIDFNKNGSFSDAGEKVVSGTSSSSGNYFAVFSVPSGLSTGVTGMRVMMSYSPVTSPCGVFSYGEVEDYVINLSNTVQSTGGGTSSADIDMIPLSEGIADNQPERDHMSLYPNPAQANITVKTISNSNETSTITVFNLSGQKMLSAQHQNAVGENAHDVDVTSLPTGIYMMEVITNNSVRREKFTVRK